MLNKYSKLKVKSIIKTIQSIAGVQIQVQLFSEQNIIM